MASKLALLAKVANVKGLYFWFLTKNGISKHTFYNVFDILYYNFSIKPEHFNNICSRKSFFNSTYFENYIVKGSYYWAKKYG